MKQINHTLITTQNQSSLKLNCVVKRTTASLFLMLKNAVPRFGKVGATVCAPYTTEPASSIYSCVKRERRPVHKTESGQNNRVQIVNLKVYKSFHTHFRVHEIYLIDFVLYKILHCVHKNSGAHTYFGHGVFFVQSAALGLHNDNFFHAWHLAQKIQGKYIPSE